MQKRFFQSIGGILLLLFFWQFSAADLPRSVGSQALPSLAPMLEKVMPAVVNISASARSSLADSPLLNDPFFRRFFKIPEKQRKPEKQSRGSGVIIDARKGYVLTNVHVIEKATQISVTLLNGRELKAKLIGVDSETDVALLKVPTGNLKALSYGDSERLRVGDFVVAIGNPFGLGQTVTSGIVSALGRSGLGIEGYEDFIQTDASINPGNSGGALVDLRGRLIGINTAILAPGGGNVGIGFAIPINMVKKVVEHLVKFGEVRRGVLGVQIQDLTYDLIKAFGLKPNQKGALIVKVEPGSAAERAGLRSRDIITAVNGKSIESSSDLRNHIGLSYIGERVRITLIRKGRTRNLYAVVADNKVQGSKISWYLKGTTLKEVSDGIKIYKVIRGSQAWNLGLRKGDIIVGFNRQELRDLNDLTNRFRHQRVRSIQVKRGDELVSIWLQ
jgi:Do/DeqQ family serine protease